MSCLGFLLTALIAYHVTAKLVLRSPWSPAHYGLGGGGHSAFVKPDILIK